MGVGLGSDVDAGSWEGSAGEGVVLLSTVSSSWQLSLKTRTHVDGSATGGIHPDRDGVAGIESREQAEDVHKRDTSMPSAYPSY